MPWHFYMQSTYSTSQSQQEQYKRIKQEIQQIEHSLDALRLAQQEQRMVDVIRYSQRLPRLRQEYIIQQQNAIHAAQEKNIKSARMQGEERHVWVEGGRQCLTCGAWVYAHPDVWKRHRKGKRHSVFHRLKKIERKWIRRHSVQ